MKTGGNVFRPLVAAPVPKQRGGGLTGARSAGSAADLMEASYFRSFAAVNGLRPPEAAREARH
jgi:hypothetical protein